MPSTRVQQPFKLITSCAIATFYIASGLHLMNEYSWLTYCLLASCRHVFAEEMVLQCATSLIAFASIDARLFFDGWRTSEDYSFPTLLTPRTILRSSPIFLRPGWQNSWGGWYSGATYEKQSQTRCPSLPRMAADVGVLPWFLSNPFR